MSILETKSVSVRQKNLGMPLGKGKFSAPAVLAGAVKILRPVSAGQRISLP